MTYYSSQFKDGLLSYKKAMVFLSKNNLTYFFVFPLIFNLFIFISGFYYLDQFLEILNSELVSYIELQTSNNSYLRSDYIFKFMYVLTWMISKIIFVFIFSLFGGYLTIILLSPVYTILSEKTATILNGTKMNFDAVQFISDILRAILIAFRNILLQLVLHIILLCFSIVPVLGWAVAFIGNLAFASYFYGFSFMDYTMERHQLSIKDSVLFVRKNKGLAVGLGVVFQVCMLVPFIGSFTASFLSIISVVSATITLEENKLLE